MYTSCITKLHSKRQCNYLFTDKRQLISTHKRKTDINFEEPEPEAKTGEEHDLEGYADDEKHFHFGFKDDESLPIFSFD